MEVGSVAMAAQVDKDFKEKQTVSLPRTLKEPLSETNFTNTKAQVECKPELFGKKHSVSRVLPNELRVNVSCYSKQCLVYQDDWLTVKYFGALDKDEGLMGVYTEKKAPVSQVTLEVRQGELFQVHVNCSKAMLTRMLRNGLPKELKDAMRYAREIM